MTKKQQQCPYCHHETGGKHCVLLEYTYLTSEMTEQDILYMFAQSAYTTGLTSSFIYGGHK